MPRFWFFGGILSIFSLDWCILAPETLLQCLRPPVSGSFLAWIPAPAQEPFGLVKFSLGRFVFWSFGKWFRPCLAALQAIRFFLHLALLGDPDIYPLSLYSLVRALPVYLLLPPTRCSMISRKSRSFVSYIRSLDAYFSSILEITSA